MFNIILNREEIFAVTDGDAPSLPNNKWRIHEVDNEWSCVHPPIFKDLNLTQVWMSHRKPGGNWKKPAHLYARSLDDHLSKESQHLLVKEHLIALRKLVEAKRQVGDV